MRDEMEVIFFNFRNKKVLGEMLGEFERFANISVPESV